MKRFGLILFSALVTSGCVPTTHAIGYASDNAIEIKYKAFDITPTLTAEATDIAVKHCAKYKKFANYRGASAPNPFGSLEIHTFACEKVKRDDASVIQADKKNYAASTDALMTTVTPTLTFCTNTATSTICTSN